MDGSGRFSLARARRFLRRRVAHALVASCLLVAGLPCFAPLALGPPLEAQETLYRGRALVDVLKALQGRGLKLVFSSTVVDETMLVTVEPVATDPRAILDEILPPLGLRAEDGPDGVVLIVHAMGQVALAGRVVSSARGTPVAGATVSIPAAQRMTTTGPDGAFLLRDVPAGAHDVVVEAPGFFPRTAAVDVRAPRTRDVLVGLEPRRDFVEEIVVTPGRVALLQQEDPSTVSLSDEDVLLAPSFGGDVSRIVESLPGVAAPDNSAAFNVRGSLAQDVSYVLDGLELYEPYHLQQFQSPFSLLDTDIVDRIDFHGGPFPADFGDRPGGIVKVSTRAPAGDARTLISIGNINSHLSYADRLPGGNASWLASLRAWYPEQFRESIEIGEPGLEPRFADAYLGATFILSPRTVLSAHSLIATDHFDFSESGELQTADTESSSGHFWVRALRSWTQEVASETILSGGWIDRFREGISDPEDEEVLVEDERDTAFFGLKHDMTWRVTDANQLKGGIDLRHLQTDYRYTSGPVADPNAIAMLTPDPSGASYGLYVADRMALTDDVALELGVRWDRQNWADDSHVSPRLGALWRVGERTELRIGLGDYFQSQRVYELRIEDGETDFRPAERSRQVGLTFTHRFAGDIRFRLDAYYRSLDDLRPRYENILTPIELYPETEPDRILIDPDGARLKGIELLVQAPPGARFYWRAGYALSSAEDVIDGDPVPRSWDQTHAGSFLVGYRLDNKWFFSLAGTAHTGWPTTPFRDDLVVAPGDPEPEVTEVAGERNSERFPTYLRFDFKASRSFTIRDGSLRFELEILNLTDRLNACCIDDVEIEVQPGGEVDVESIYGYWLGLTPTVRMIWEF